MILVVPHSKPISSLKSHHLLLLSVFCEKLLVLASVGLKVAAVAISILALTYSGDTFVLRRVNMYNKICLVV